MNRILFVDDEPRVLQGLRRMLRSVRREWDIEFAESGLEALNRLADSPFDAIVTDMRMPGMDGAQLLHEVMNRFPDTVRVVLSGQCDQDAVLKCVGPAHQFLTKPCDPGILKSTISRIFRFRDMIVGQGRKCTVPHPTAVPSHPLAYRKLIAEMESPEPSMQAIAELVSRDAGMTAKTFQLISSSFFGTPQHAANPEEAVRLLGLDRLKPLVLTTKAFVPFNGDASGIRWLEKLTDQSLRTATTARAIAECETTDDLLIGDAFLAGFLCNLGILVSALARTGNGLPTSCPQSADMNMSEAHANAGAYLLALWGLPDPIVTAIAMHMNPGRSADQSFTPLTALHAATALLKEADDARDASTSLSIDYVKRIGCNDHIDRWRQICRTCTPEGALS